MTSFVTKAGDFVLLVRLEDGCWVREWKNIGAVNRKFVAVGNAEAVGVIVSTQVFGLIGVMMMIL